jgi:hypothetical protein
MNNPLLKALKSILRQDYNTKLMAENRKLYPEYYKQIAAGNRERTKARVFLLYGNQCDKCGFNDPRALQLDHKSRPEGACSTEHHIHAQELCRAILSGKENWLNYQLLCANCNWIKRHVNNERGLFHGLHDVRIGMDQTPQESEQ